MQPSLLDLISSYSTILANGNQIAGWIIFTIAILLFASSFIPTPMPRDDFAEPYGDIPAPIAPNYAQGGGHIAEGGGQGHSVASSASVVEGQ